jgi:hypothetical protein
MNFLIRRKRKLKASVTGRLLRFLKNPVPVKEHGAWAILLIPMFSGAMQARAFSVGAFLLFISAFFLFLAYHPFEISRQYQANGVAADKAANACFWLLVYAFIGCNCGASLIFLYHRYYLLPFGMVAAFLFLASVAAQKRKKLSQTRELLGIFALSLGAPAMFYVITGEINFSVAKLWLINVLFFLSASFFVHLKISEKSAAKCAGNAVTYRETFRRNLFYQSSLLLLLVSGYVYNVISLPVVLAYLPMVLHCLGSARREPGILNFKKTGLIFTAYSVCFGILISL